MHKRKKREELGQAIVEGPRMVMDLLRCADTASLVRQIIVDCDKYDDCYATELESLISLMDTNDDDNRREGKDSSSTYGSLPQYPPQILLATPQVLQACTDTVTNQGIVAMVDIPKYNQELLVERSKTTNNNNNTSSALLYLVLDGVSDPGNVGTLIRSARATGVAATLLLPGSVDPFNPKAVRSAMGTTFSLPVLQLDSWDECCRLLHRVGCQQIWAATMLEDKNDDDDNDDLKTSTNNERNKEHYQVNWMAEPASALVIGNEGNGLTLPVRASVEQGHIRIIDDKTTSRLLPVNAVHIPMQAGVESLNAAVCGSVILFEYQRQLLTSRGARTTR